MGIVEKYAKKLDKQACVYALARKENERIILSEGNIFTRLIEEKKKEIGTQV